MTVGALKALQTGRFSPPGPSGARLRGAAAVRRGCPRRARKGLARERGRTRDEAGHVPDRRLQDAVHGAELRALVLAAQPVLHATTAYDMLRMKARRSARPTFWADADRSRDLGIGAYRSLCREPRRSRPVVSRDPGARRAVAAGAHRGPRDRSRHAEMIPGVVSRGDPGCRGIRRPRARSDRVSEPPEPRSERAGRSPITASRTSAWCATTSPRHAPTSRRAACASSRADREDHRARDLLVRRPLRNVFILMEKSAAQLPYFRQWAATARYSSGA